MQKLWTAIVLVLLALGPVWAGSAKLRRLAKKSGVPLKTLEAVKAERYFSRKRDQRRAFIKDLALKPRSDTLPLLTFIGTTETKDESIRRCAIRLYGHLGLLADRREIIARVLPAVRKALSYGPKRGQDQRWAFDELEKMARWFAIDEELARLMVPVFNGKDTNLRSFAFRSFCSIRHEELEEKLVIPACLQVYSATKGYSLFDRWRAVRQLERRRIELIAPALRDRFAKDPKMQLDAFRVFTKWQDRSALGLARGIPKTALHKLRRAAFRARVALADPTTISETAGLFAADHVDMISFCLEELGRLDDDKSLKFLRAAFAAKLYPKARAARWVQMGQSGTVAKERSQIHMAAALALLRRGEWKAAKDLKAVIVGDGDAKLRRRAASVALGIDNAQAASILVAILGLKTEDFAAIRLRAVKLAGERKISAARKALGEIYWDKANYGHLKWHSGVSFLEVDGKKALSSLLWYVPKYVDAITKDERRPYNMGQTLFKLKRWQGSGFLESLDKWERTKDPRVLPVILEMLRPVKEAKPTATPKKPKKKKKRRPSGTKSRSRGKELDFVPKGPAPVYRVKNQFVRARAVEVAALIGGDAAGPVLARAIDDHRTVVRAAALRAIGKLSGRYQLPYGANAAAERKQRATALACWLRKG